MSKLIQRIITAVVLIAFLLLVLFVLPARIALAVFGALMLVGAWEWAGFLGARPRATRFWYIALVGAALLASTWIVLNEDVVLAVMRASLLWWLVAFFWVFRFPTPIHSTVIAVCGLLVLLPAWLGVGYVLLTEPKGPELIMLVLVIVWSADIGAYFIGRRLGRVKLAPSVSPGKTWEGLLGGLGGAAIGAAAGGWYFGWPPSLYLPLGISVGAISVVGDLTVSMFKRNADLKDSGRLFPGHGGMLDRIDSVNAAVPLYVIELSWFQLLTG